MCLKHYKYQWIDEWVGFGGVPHIYIYLTASWECISSPTYKRIWLRSVMRDDTRVERPQSAWGAWLIWSMDHTETPLQEVRLILNISDFVPWCHMYMWRHLEANPSSPMGACCTWHKHLLDTRFVVDVVYVFCATFMPQQGCMLPPMVYAIFGTCLELSPHRGIGRISQCKYIGPRT